MNSAQAIDANTQKKFCNFQIYGVLPNRNAPKMGRDPLDGPNAIGPNVIRERRSGIPGAKSGQSCQNQRTPIQIGPNLEKVQPNSSDELRDPIWLK